MKINGYIKTNKQLEKLLQKATKLGGFDNLDNRDKVKLQQLTDKLSKYENKYFGDTAITKDIPTILYSIIVNHQLSVQQLADELNTTNTLLYMILKGKRKLGVDRARLLHKKYNCDIKLLFELC